MIDATYRAIRPTVNPWHEWCDERVAVIAQAVRDAGQWMLPPVLVIDDQGNGHTPMDGHHRLMAADLLARDPETAHLVETIPAWVIDPDDVDALLGGLSLTDDRIDWLDVDATIICDGTPYAGRINH